MYRIGQSTDIHRFCEGDHIVLGGVMIPFEKGIEAHSDGDVLCHAIGESILGALALGDLGKHFPDTDDTCKGMSSIAILEEIYSLMQNEGYQINNVDSLVLIEQPKMAPHIEEMRKHIAEALHCDITQISCKATRGEKIGFVGREEGVMCQSICMLKSK